MSCEICTRSASFACPACPQRKIYCSVDCQRSDWSTHRTQHVGDKLDIEEAMPALTYHDIDDNSVEYTLRGYVTFELQIEKRVSGTLAWIEHFRLEDGVFLAKDDAEMATKIAHAREAWRSIPEKDCDACLWLETVITNSAVYEGDVGKWNIWMVDQNRVIKFTLAHAGELEITERLAQTRGLSTIKPLVVHQEISTPYFEKATPVGMMIFARYPIDGAQFLRSLPAGMHRIRQAWLIAAQALAELAQIKRRFPYFVHGDLHPGNLFFGEVDSPTVTYENIGTLTNCDAGRVVLADFGRSVLRFAGLRGMIRQIDAVPGLVLSESIDAEQLFGKIIALVPEGSAQWRDFTQRITITSAQTEELVNDVLKAIPVP